MVPPFIGSAAQNEILKLKPFPGELLKYLRLYHWDLSLLVLPGGNHYSKGSLTTDSMAGEYLFTLLCLKLGGWLYWKWKDAPVRGSSIRPGVYHVARFLSAGALLAPMVWACSRPSHCPSQVTTAEAPAPSLFLDFSFQSVTSSLSLHDCHLNQVIFFPVQKPMHRLLINFQEQLPFPITPAMTHLGQASPLTSPLWLASSASISGQPHRTPSSSKLAGPSPLFKMPLCC